MYVGLKQPRGDGKRYVTPARAAAKETSAILGIFVSFPQKRNGIVFSSGVNYLHSGGNIQSE